MEVFEMSTLIKCSADELFDFHLDSNNLLKIMPTNISVDLLTPIVNPKEGDILKLKSTKNSIPINWIVRLEKIEKPNKLIDVAIKSPFKYWEHQHIFIQHKKFTELKDIIIYEMPFGLLGKVFQPFIHNDLYKMFEHRQNKTKKILEKL